MRPPAWAPLALALVLLGAPVEAQPSRLAGFDLLRLTPSARGAALAGAYAPAAPSADAALYNPAFLAEAAHGRLAVSALDHVAGLWVGGVAYARHLGPLDGTAALALRHLGYGTFERATPEGTAEGRFGASETALTLAFARPVAPGVQAGGAAHLAVAVLDDASAVALAADVGVAYASPERDVVLAATLRHGGTVLRSLGTTEDRLAPDLRLTLSRRLARVPFRATLTAYDLLGVEPHPDGALRTALRHVAFGGELELGSALALRVGLDPRRRDDLATGQRLDLAGVHAGFGLDLRRVGFDYAYQAWSSFGGLHHVTVRTRL